MSDTIFCVACGTANTATIMFCPKCGTPKQNPSQITATQDFANPPQPYFAQPQQSGQFFTGPDVPPANKVKFGLALASLIVAVVGVLFGLYDIGAVVDAPGSYIATEEIGYLAIISFTALGLAIPAVIGKQRAAIAALVVSVLAVFIMFAATGYMQ